MEFSLVPSLTSINDLTIASTPLLNSRSSRRMATEDAHYDESNGTISQSDGISDLTASATHQPVPNRSGLTNYYHQQGQRHTSGVSVPGNARSSMGDDSVSPSSSGTTFPHERPPILPEFFTSPVTRDSTTSQEPNQPSQSLHHRHPGRDPGVRLAPVEMVLDEGRAYLVHQGGMSCQCCPQENGHACTECHAPRTLYQAWQPLEQQHDYWQNPDLSLPRWFR
ncbi:uncharacterized protein E0L32_011546 [Thyridium curvatum]|uniref:Uncharacterized protein n=1 Tax=Thyridium curvatum TaxID=1093900 RepID=A0A507BFV8_9PEZI|nr:uncharacterized protein E0L32_011546 [Thyridium curvatum]TPX18797.1 hypothetical protein E0L32_011546 [Thyridium curvatum]